MEHGIINGFSNRDKLIERLVDSYNNKTAPEIILLTGPAGSGKSFVANNVVKKCEKISRMRSYINRGDSFVSPSAVGNMPKLRVDNLSLSASFLYMSAGLEVGAHREESQYNHLKALLRSFQNHRFLFCLDGLSSAHSQVKSMAQLLLSHREDLERALSSKVYFLVTDTSDTMFLSMGSGAERITHFALLGLAYTSRFSSIDFDLLSKIDDAINKYGTAEQKEDFQEIKDFYEMIVKSPDTQDLQGLHSAYLRLKRKGFDVPLKAELSRAYFHYLYRTHSPYNQDLKLLFEECLSYANHEILLTDSVNPIKLKPMDETIVRLNIIYTVAPYLLDVLNRDDEFTELYKLSLSLSNACSSKSAKGLGQYIENVFNRKAFLFVNQTQCTPYYERAKSYFSRNQIWDEMCLTLVCQAGTDIVIQQYDDAQELCKQAQEIADHYGITLPQPEKLQNNFLIAEFLQAEAQAKSEKVCLTKARQTFSKLKKLLHKKPCATEFVILTNICSLCLYSGNDQQYLKYKAMLERQMTCKDVSDVSDLDIDDFYRYYFAWFEVFRMIRDGNWEMAEQLSQSVHGFIPALFKKQEKFWEMKDQALADVIRKRISMSAYDFCHNLVHVNRKENTLSRFFFRGLMLSDLQYTSYN